MGASSMGRRKVVQPTFNRAKQPLADATGLAKWIFDEKKNNIKIATTVPVSFDSMK
jgi:hypothetical protein